ncbi:50S ribosomal protein L4 [Patescibacteria group bacterium]|nr:50S ribosomal protein L4 [Candidatus Falkowbacteria bacterium]MBU3905445.1 50S ribosomal protein L4 [Patescibacteria group bacterium]MBU4014625.1 50S ribosomal protein L4 [Patescibacteria group bacterium]MBU4027101.1 50S ribosomal protein L4 [Patescibacteria group bacterium]MBU4073327.1 50S ribosomal protein L4 [Patescibacteria group bacterium]
MATEEKQNRSKGAGSIAVKIYNQKAEQVGDMKLADKVFGVKTSEALVHQAMVAQMSNERQVLAHTKDRGEVRGGGKKPWRQKGTGRARVGSSRSPIWIGGGVTFGPRKDRNFKKNINKKMRQKAMFMALSDRVESGNMAVLEKLEMAEFKTKEFNIMLSCLEKNVLAARKHENTKAQKHENNKTIKHENKKNIKRSVLLINDKKDDKVKYSGRNLTGVEIINLENINLLDLLKYRNVILTVDAVKALEAKYNK